MIEFSPTTTDVRNGYSYDPEAEYYDPLTNHTLNNRRAFDRWLAAHDAEKDAEIERLRAVIAETAKWRHDWFEPPESETYPHKTRLHVRKLDAILDKAAQ